MTPSPSETALAIYKNYSMVSFQTKFNKGHCLPKEIAKKCALIDVQGKIEELKYILDYKVAVFRITYWQQVKEAIEKV